MSELKLIFLFIFLSAFEKNFEKQLFLNSCLQKSFCPSVVVSAENVELYYMLFK
jgi:hypothetical protein